MRRHALPILLAVTAATALPVHAEPIDPPAGEAGQNHALTAGQAGQSHALTGDGRYQLMDINDKIVRLDTRTGRFELCRMDGEDWKCLVAQDERQRLETTISDLAKRVATLETARRADAQAQQVSGAPASATPVATAPVSTASVSTARAIPASTAPASTAPATQLPARVVSAPIVAEAAPGAMPEGPIPAEPVPSKPVPTASVPTSTAPASQVPVATGKPFDISPTATAEAAADAQSPGLLDRITGLVSNLNW